MEMQKGIWLLRSSAFIAGGAKGVGHGTVGPDEPTPVTWFGTNPAVHRVTRFL
jgi:hypothetical protein